MLTVASAAQATAVSVAMDMTTGIIARFRTMAISRASVLTGHVLGSMIQSVIGITVIIGIALLVGFRPSAGPLAWLAATGLLVLTAFALTWLSVAFGLVSKTVETASNLPMFLMLLPFLGSGFVPTASMPAGLRWFAEYQPFTPVTQTLRRLARGRPDRRQRHHRGRLGRRRSRCCPSCGQGGSSAVPRSRPGDHSGRQGADSGQPSASGYLHTQDAGRGASGLGQDHRARRQSAGGPSRRAQCRPGRR